MARHYWLTITDENGILIGRIQMDGFDLRRGGDAQALISDIESEMGRNHVKRCAELPGTVGSEL